MLHPKSQTSRTMRLLYVLTYWGLNMAPGRQLVICTYVSLEMSCSLSVLRSSPVLCFHFLSSLLCRVSSVHGECSVSSGWRDWCQSNSFCSHRILCFRHQPCELLFFSLFWQCSNVWGGENIINISRASLRS